MSQKRFHPLDLPHAPWVTPSECWHCGGLGYLVPPDRDLSLPGAMEQVEQEVTRDFGSHEDRLSAALEQVRQRRIVG